MCENLGALTAEDWEAARESLGCGSWSLPTGTSTRALDAIAQGYTAEVRTAEREESADTTSATELGRAIATLNDQDRRLVSQYARFLASQTAAGNSRGRL